jgi:hypothetical protein
VQNRGERVRDVTPAALRGTRTWELPPEEFERLRGFAPFDRWPVDQPIAPGARIIVAETVEAEGAARLVGFWVAFNVVHLEPLWIDPAQRGNAGIARGMLDRISKVLDEDRVTVAYATIADVDAERMAPLAARAGFTKIPGSLYVLERRPAPPPAPVQKKEP